MISHCWTTSKLFDIGMYKPVIKWEGGCKVKMLSWRAEVSAVVINFS